MLALATGWTQRVISGDTGEVSDDFRRACHWALYDERVSSILADHERVAGTPGPATLTANEQAAYGRARLEARANATLIRTLLYPEDDDG